MKQRLILLGAVIVSAHAANASILYQLDCERTLGEPAGGGATVSNSVTQAGWTSSAADNGGSSATLPTPAGVAITAGGSGYFQGRSNTTTWGAVNVTDAAWDNVVGDTVAARGGDGTVTISFTGLTPGVEHQLTAWHNVSASDSPSFSSGLYTITPSITTGTLVGSPTAGAASNIAHTAVGVVAADFDNSVINFMPDGSGNASILLTSASSSQFLTLSGVQLDSVPEPSGAALFGLGSLALLLRRRRK